jgi:hypothetical protein
LCARVEGFGADWDGIGVSGLDDVGEASHHSNIPKRAVTEQQLVSTQFLFALRHLPICEIDRRPKRGLHRSHVPLLRAAANCTATEAQRAAVPVGPSGPEAAGGEAH